MAYTIKINEAVQFCFGITCMLKNFMHRPKQSYNTKSPFTASYNVHARANTCIYTNVALEYSHKTENNFWRLSLKVRRECSSPLSPTPLNVPLAPPL